MYTKQGAVRVVRVLQVTRGKVQCGFFFNQLEKLKKKKEFECNKLLFRKMNNNRSSPRTVNMQL